MSWTTLDKISFKLLHSHVKTVLQMKNEDNWFDILGEGKISNDLRLSFMLVISLLTNLFEIYWRKDLENEFRIVRNKKEIHSNPEWSLKVFEWLALHELEKND